MDFDYYFRIGSTLFSSSDNVEIAVDFYTYSATRELELLNFAALQIQHMCRYNPYEG